MTRPRNAPAGLNLSGDQQDLGKREQIKAALETFIRNSPPDSLVPSERVLAEQFNVARMTVRSVMNALESGGMIRRVPGRGAFVQHPRLVHSEIFRSFSEDMRLRGMVPGAKDFRITTEKADRACAHNLGVNPGDEIYFIERVRTADAIPMAIERTRLPAARFPGLTGKLYADDSLYQVLQTEYGVQLETAEQSVAIARLDAADARRLETVVNEPCFAVTRRAHDNMGKIVEFGRSLYRGDRYVIEMHVGRDRGNFPS